MTQSLGRLQTYTGLEAFQLLIKRDRWLLCLDATVRGTTASAYHKYGGHERHKRQE
jgi:hypothetical protein